MSNIDYHDPGVYVRNALTNLSVWAQVSLKNSFRYFEILKITENQDDWQVQKFKVFLNYILIVWVIFVFGTGSFGQIFAETFYL